MKILIVDDQLSRHRCLVAQYRTTYPGCHLDIASHAGAAIQQLQAEVYDLLSLDFDLVVEQPPGEERSGLDVARVMVLMAEPSRPRKVIVHSWNTTGASEIASLLSAAGMTYEITPFVYTKIGA